MLRTDKAHISPLWVATADGGDYPRLEGDLTVDVAILGGGITGLTCALLLEQAGARVAVLEARRVGRSVTGYSTAKVSSLHGLTYAHLISTFGEDVARAYGEANEGGLERMARIVSELDIDCDFERRSNYTYTESPEEREQIEKEVEAALKVGLAATYTEETDLPFPVVAAVRFDDQAQFHPCRYLQGLAAAVDGDGAHVFEGTRAVSVDAGRPCLVRTENGARVVADRVVVATHMPILDRGLFFARVSPQRAYVVAARTAAPSPQGMYLSTEQPAHSIRSHSVDGDELVLVAGESHKTGHGDAAERYRRLEAWARDRFDVESVEYRWATQDNMPADGLPYIGRLWPLSNRIYTATGFKKWGLAKGTAAAMILSDLILGRPNPWAGVFDPTRAHVRAATPKLVKENADVGLRFFGDRVVKRGSAADLVPGEGRVVRSGLGQAAVYKDESGRLHAVSARCSHLGCIVSWNNAERTWDCPCHGSRFGVDGEVVQGPAVHPLAKRDPPG